MQVCPIGLSTSVLYSRLLLLHSCATALDSITDLGKHSIPEHSWITVSLYCTYRNPLSLSECTDFVSRGGSRDFPSPSSSSSMTKFVVISFVVIPEDGLRERLTIKYPSSPHVREYCQLSSLKTFRFCFLPLFHQFFV